MSVSQENRGRPAVPKALTVTAGRIHAGFAAEMARVRNGVHTMKRIVFAGGGTGGHIYPAVSIARAFQKKYPGVDIQFVGAAGGLEERLIPKEGFPLHLLPVGQLHSSAGRVRQIKTLLMMPLSLLKATLLVLKLKPDMVVGVGGYASAPFVLMASLLGRTCVLFEPNAYPGLANRWLARFASLSLVVFEKAARILEAKNFVRVGLPVRDELVAAAHQAAAVQKGAGVYDIRNGSGAKLGSASASADAPSDGINGAGATMSGSGAGLDGSGNITHPFRVLIFGGSQGARAINKVIFQAVSAGEAWLKNIHLIHQVGRADFSQAQVVYGEARQKYPWLRAEETEFLFDMPQKYLWADLVICRAGASTVAEVIVMKKPALFVPLPTAADDHQTQNAKALSEKGAAILCPQGEFTAVYLQHKVLELQKSPQGLQNMAKQLESLQIPNAAEQIVAQCEKFFPTHDTTR
jgi:UDP-N-acetylglucosamine--N-acetylmuramyl-(pentapeptide) pyrophosphoryl-undecaprenol N-acetylglucosamine transferase